MDKNRNKTGGRAKGTPNKITVQKRLEAQRDIDAAMERGRPLGKDRVYELENIAVGVMASFQPVTAEMVEKAREAGNTKIKERRGDIDLFGRWWDRACYAAQVRTKYESPTFRAIMMEPPKPQTPSGDQITIVRLKVFEKDRVVGEYEQGKLIDGTAEEVA